MGIVDRFISNRAILSDAPRRPLLPPGCLRAPPGATPQMNAWSTGAQNTKRCIGYCFHIYVYAGQPEALPGFQPPLVRRSDRGTVAAVPMKGFFMRLNHSAQTIAAVALCAITLVACSSSDDAAESSSTSASTSAQQESATASSSATTTDTEESSFPVTVNAGLNEKPVTLEAMPEKIVSLSPTATEDLFAIGAGDQVVAADSYSNFPPSAPATDLSGFKPNAEAVMKYQPDLVVVSGDQNNIVASLEELSVPVMVLPAAKDLDQVYTQLEQLGAATGHVGEAAGVVAETQSRISAAVEKVGDKARGKTYYHEVDPTFYTVGNDSFLGNVYSLFGMTSIAPSDAGPFPQMNQEAIVTANPDVILLADTGEGGGVTPEEIKARPGWESIPAVQSGTIIELNKDLASRWSPRIAEFVESLVPTLSQLPEGAAANN